MSRGYVWLHRSTLKCEDIRTATDLGVWAMLLMEADRFTGEVRVSMRSIERRLRLSPHTVAATIDHFEKASMVTRASNGRGTKIQVHNWSSYQRDGDALEHRTDAPEQRTAAVEHRTDAVEQTVKKRKKKRTIRVKYSEEFDQFWILYERKGNKKPAFAQWQKLTETQKKTARYLTTQLKRDTEKKFRKDCERFLRDSLDNESGPAPTATEKPVRTPEEYEAHINEQRRKEGW